MWVWLVVVLLIVFVIVNSTRKKTWKIPKGTFNDPLNNQSSRNWYDVAIVGAGPSGASAAFYLRKHGVRVLLLEKKKFPRDKYCGDAVCKTAIELLIEMDIYQKLIKQGKAQIADSGGLVSPGGLSFVGRSHQVLGAIPAAMAVKRTDLDEAIAMRAKEVGADLKELHTVLGASFNKATSRWTVKCEVGAEGDEDDNKAKATANTVEFEARLLVCADGATSKLAGQLGVVTNPPNGVCSRAFVEGGTHQFDADGVVFYNKDMLPGYSALFRHPKDELNFCCYLIPGNPKVTNDTLKYWHHYLIEKDPHISQALGPKAKIERMKSASLRLGGEERTYGDHLLLIGDAAGFIDPMTGEGIHHAMDSGRMAAETIVEAMNAGNYSSEGLKVYQLRWKQAFGNDFVWSMRICQLCYRFPILLDAATAAIVRKGNTFLARWAEIMTGRVPKFHLLHPEFVIVITYELIALLLCRRTKTTTTTTTATAPSKK